VQQQEQRQQPLSLRLAGHQPGEHRAIRTASASQVKPHQGAGCRRVAFVEDQVDDGEDRFEAGGKFGFSGHAVGMRRP